MDETPQDKRAWRLAMLRAAYEDFVGKVKTNVSRLMYVCPPPSIPTYHGKLNEVGGALQYYLPILEMPSGIPTFEPTERRLVPWARPVGFGNGNSALVRDYKEVIIPGALKEYMPSTRWMGCLVTVSQVWQDGWRAVYKLTMRMTPLSRSIEQRSWWYYEREPAIVMPVRHVAPIEGYTYGDEIMEKSHNIKTRLAERHKDETVDDDEIHGIGLGLENRDAWARPAYPWE